MTRFFANLLLGLLVAMSALPQAKTPNIDRLAERGVLFDHRYATEIDREIYQVALDAVQGLYRRGNLGGHVTLLCVPGVP
jgi:hypothetical protein